MSSLKRLWPPFALMLCILSFVGGIPSVGYVSNHVRLLKINKMTLKGNGQNERLLPTLSDIPANLLVQQTKTSKSAIICLWVLLYVAISGRLYPNMRVLYIRHIRWEMSDMRSG